MEYQLELDGIIKHKGTKEGCVGRLVAEAHKVASGGISSKIRAAGVIHEAMAFGGSGSDTLDIPLPDNASATIKPSAKAKPVDTKPNCFCVTVNDVITCIGTRFACVVHAQEALVPFGMDAHEQIKGVAAFALETGDKATVTINTNIIEIERMQ